MSSCSPASATPVPRVALLVRTSLYAAMWLFSLLTMALAAASINATLSSFYGFGLNATCVLIAAGAIGLLVLPPLHLLFHRRASDSWAASVTCELAVLVVLFALFLGGAAATAQNISALEYWFGSYDDIYPLTAAAMAMAWIAWFLVWVTATLVLWYAGQSQKVLGSAAWSRQLGAADSATLKSVESTPKPEMVAAPASAPAVVPAAGTAQEV